VKFFPTDPSFSKINQNIFNVKMLRGIATMEVVSSRTKHSIGNG